MGCVVNPTKEVAAEQARAPVVKTPFRIIGTQTRFLGHVSPMRLTFNSPYLSISSFPTVDLPDFTVITGANGAGKTHLLKAIGKGSVRADVAPNPEADAKFFDFSTLAPNNTGEFQTIGLYQERDEIFQLAQKLRKVNSEDLNQWGVKYGVNIRNRWALLREGKDYLGTVVQDDSQIDAAWEELQAIGNRVFSAMNENLRRQESKLARLDFLRTKVGLGIVYPFYRDFADDPLSRTSINVFQQSFAQLFLGYFELDTQNQLRRLQVEEGQTPDTPVLSPEEFVTKYKEPPWDFVNRILREARLDFDIDYPTERSTIKFTPQLRKTTSGAELQFSDLSSGEKILMSFTLCLYYSLDNRHEVAFPKLLLLDEIDAPLHPSMSRQLVKTIQTALVADQDVKVILATHAPATIAVCPEDAIFVMRHDQPGLHKVGKRQAIAVLTSEIPTLAIDFSGRRQVFVESQNDAARYEELYRYLSPNIDSERSLVFIGVGGRTSGGDIAGGCEQVKRVVAKLVDGGNESVFGLIDWDNTNQRDGRVMVLAQGRRYAVENCLLDPLLVAAIAIYCDCKKLGPLVGLPDGKGYPDLRDLSREECHAMVESVNRLVLRIPRGGDLGDCVTVKYYGGLQALVSTQYLQKDGHDLESAVKSALPPLKQFESHGGLLTKVVGQVIREFPQLTPIELVEAFESILTFESSS